MTPKFVSPQGAAYPDYRLVGDAYGPTAMPDHQVTVSPQYITYQTLYSFVEPIYQDPMAGNGDMTIPKRVAYPGSYGVLYRTGRSR